MVEIPDFVLGERMSWDRQICHTTDEQRGRKCLEHPLIDIYISGIKIEAKFIKVNRKEKGNEKAI